VGMETCATTTEISMKIPQKTKNRSTLWPYHAILEPISEVQINVQERHLHAHVYLVLFTIAKLWMEQSCPTTNKWIKKIQYIYIYVYICREIDMYIYTVKERWEMNVSFAAKWM
jgi:hypothetical protein